MDAHDIPTPGHCALGSDYPPRNAWATIASATPARTIGADFAAPETTDQTITRRARFAYVSEEDFELMLEVDLAYVDWLLRRRFLY